MQKYFFKKMFRREQIFTNAYRPRTYIRWEVMFFHRLCVCSTFGGGYPVPSLGRGVPQPRSGRGGTPSQVSPEGDKGPPVLEWGYPPGSGMGYPPPDLGWGTPQTWDRVPSPSIGSTCYAVGGMPLAFTQEDFLVIS